MHSFIFNLRYLWNKFYKKFLWFFISFIWMYCFLLGTFLNWIELFLGNRFKSSRITLVVSTWTRLVKFLSCTSLNWKFESVFHIYFPFYSAGNLQGKFFLQLLHWYLTYMSTNPLWPFFKWNDLDHILGAGTTLSLIISYFTISHLLD